MYRFVRMFAIAVAVLITATGCATATRFADLPQEPGFYDIGNINLVRPSTTSTIMVDKDGNMIRLDGGAEQGVATGVIGKAVEGAVGLYLGRTNIKIGGASATGGSGTGGSATGGAGGSGTGGQGGGGGSSTANSGSLSTGAVTGSGASVTGPYVGK